MDLKWLALAVIVAVAAAVYARAMRVYGKAGWREVLLPWRVPS
jgi:hypothetical protein